MIRRRKARQITLRVLCVFVVNWVESGDHMSSRTSHRVSLLFALIVLGLTVYSVTLAPPPVCGGLPAGYAPIIAFELARSVSDLHAIFGSAPSACRTAIAHQMDFINTVDSFPFIPAYGLFLVFFFLGKRERNSGIAMLAVAITVVACLADCVENYALFHLSPDPDHATWIPLLVAATETKWIGLGIAGALAVPLLWNGWLGWLSVALCGIGLVATLLTIPMSAAVGPQLSNALAVGWLLFFAVDIRESFRRASSTVS
jgi:hypothetical protein